MKRIICAVLLLAGCAYSSGVIEEASERYRIQSHAALVRGGTTAALGIAHQDAQTFCENKQARCRGRYRCGTMERRSALPLCVIGRRCMTRRFAAIAGLHRTGIYCPLRVPTREAMQKPMPKFGLLHRGFLRLSAKR